MLHAATSIPSPHRGKTTPSWASESALPHRRTPFPSSKDRHTLKPYPKRLASLPLLPHNAAMQTIKLLAGMIAAFFAVIFAVLWAQRRAMSYDAEGRAFDAQTGISYSDSSVIVLAIGALLLAALAALLFLWIWRDYRKGRVRPPVSEPALSTHLLALAVAPLSDTDIDRRMPLWSALGELYLDTQSDLNVPFIVRTAKAGGFTAAEVEQILLWEVRPALYENLLSMAGEWAGWDQNWLRGQILETMQRRPPPLGLGSGFVPDELPEILAALRADGAAEA